MNLPWSKWFRRLVALAFVFCALPTNVFAQVPVDRDIYDVCSLWEGVLRQVNGGVVTGSEIRTQMQAAEAVRPRLGCGLRMSARYESRLRQLRRMNGADDQHPRI